MSELKYMNLNDLITWFEMWAAVLLIKLLFFLSQITLISSKIMIHTHINTHYTYIKGENNSIEIRGGCRNPCNWRHNTKKFQIHIELGELFPFIQQKLRTSNQIYLNYIRISETSRGHVTPHRRASVRPWLRYFLLTNMIFF